MLACLCAAVFYAVIFVCTNAVAADNAAFDVQHDVVWVANASIGYGQKLNQRIDKEPGLPWNEFHAVRGARKVAGK